MIRQLTRLVPEAHRPLLPRYGTALIVLSIAQGIAYVLLAPLLEDVFADRLDRAGWWLAGIVAAYLVVAVASFLQAQIGLRIGVALMRHLQMRLGDHLGAMPLGAFGPSTSGQASRLITSSTREVMGVFAHLLTPLVTAVLVPMTVAVGMLFIDWRISLAMVVSAPVLYFVNKWGGSLYAHATVGQHQAAAEANSRVIEFAQAQPVLRAFGADDAGTDALRTALREQGRATTRSIWASVPGLVIFAFVVQLTFIPLVWLAISLSTSGEISVPVAIALIAVSSRFVEPLNQAAELSTAIRRAMVAVNKINKFLDTPVVAEPAEPTQPVDAGVRFDDVTFGYRSDNTVLEGVSFKAPAGTTTAIVGPSGAGKTTVLRLAARFYDADSGRILLGDRDVRDLTSETLLNQVSLVFQDVYLFDQTVLDNIRVGRPDATDDEVLQAARTARVDEIAARLPEGWDTRVGEGGTALSGGERQRISIARALLKNAPIVLLDEATSALDPQNEAAVVRGIRELTQGKTVLVVAHRLPTIRHADQILFLDEGGIVERGTHDELVAADGRYAAFWSERTRAAGWRLTAARG
ncbi:ABC transporter ATP-binding protein [Nocardia cyriacigeorgica]|uniref:ABC transporter ATP-binding protein n=1 Tax=Nocardia cyriacigeorgica TaxID=135487 RepID=A0A6P1D6Y8_9NOCA|nr:ABC transporter ATP-binding protein [Nocardia cyriacigeorgica]NEW44770.1 ABC transporter ATP-binding protein [Nocardia cyriacigeorgica]